MLLEFERRSPQDEIKKSMLFSGRRVRRKSSHRRPSRSRSTSRSRRGDETGGPERKPSKHVSWEQNNNQQEEKKDEEGQKSSSERPGRIEPIKSLLKLGRKQAVSPPWSCLYMYVYQHGGVTEIPRLMCNGKTEFYLLSFTFQMLSKFSCSHFSVFRH